MADNNMKVQATVELPSAKKVNEQIRALEKSISKLKISGKFDETVLKNLTKQLTTLKATVSTASFSPAALKNLTDQVNRALSNINISGVNIKDISDVSFDSSFGKELEKNLSHLSKLKEEWLDQGIYVDEFKTKVETLEKSLQEISVGDIKGLNTVKEQISSLSSEAKKLLQIQEIQLLTNGGIENDYDTQLAKLESSFTRLGITGDELTSKTSGVTTALSELRERLAQPLNESNYNEIISLNKKLQDEFIKSRNESARMNATIEMATDSNRLNNAAQMQKWADNNSDAMKRYGNRINEIIFQMSDLNKVMTQADATKLQNEFKALQSEAELTSNIGITAINKLKKAYEKFSGRNLINDLRSALWQQLKKMPNEVYEIDTAMTSLYRVTDETSSKYQQFLDSASNSAQKLGRSISSLVEQTANWAKLGFDLDTSAKLAEISSVYANVGEIDDDTAISNLVTAMKAFNIEASNSMIIVDSLNKLGNEFATDAKSLGEGLKTTASSMAAAGNDLHQTLAILAGAGEITQNVSELSSGLQVVSMRLRGMKDELQSIGEEYEDIESISKIQEQISNLTNGSVNILNVDGSFKSTYDQLKEISEIYFDLSESDRADLTEILFGKNRSNQGIAIIQAFQSGEIQKAYEASVKSAGSAMEEQEKWLESLEAKTQQFNAAFQSLSSTVLDSNLLKWFVDLGTSGVKALDQIIDKFGLLSTIGLSAGLFAGFKNVGSPKMFGLKIVLNIPTVC